MKKMNSSEGWLVVFAGFLTLTVAAGIGWYVFPVYLGVIHEEMGWSITQLTFGITIWALAGAVFSPLVGAWIDKYGPRRLIVTGTICQIVVTILLSRMTELWHMYVLFVGAAFASTANTYIPISTAIAQWFDEKRGMAMGVALVGMGVGGIFVPPLATAFLGRFGWRTGYLIFSVFLVALLVPISLWIKTGPGIGDNNDGPQKESGEDSQEGPQKDSAPEAPAEDTGGLTAAEAMRTRSFWTLGLGDMLIGVVFTTVIINMVFFSMQAGVSEWSATFAYSTFLAFTAAGIFIFGAATDKVKIRWLMIFCYGVPAIAMLFLFRLPSLPFLFLFAIIFGATGGGRSALWPLALGRCFGVRHVGSIFGWLNIPFMLGNAIGPVLGGYIFDRTGSYGALFGISAAASAISIVFISLMRKEYGSARLQEGL
jgi:MFS family permease